MGFFSWTCAKTGLPVMSSYAVEGHKELDFLCHAVVLFPNGDKITGVYDGYGRIGMIDLLEVTGPFKMVIRKYYNDEKYDDLRESENEPNQGYFWNDDELIQIVKEVEGRLYGGYIRFPNNV